VRTFDDPLLADCVRITVGRPADNDQLLRAVSGVERASDA
jgi:histidinol-phosphate/aromatic aminotransferase/cobyric acid decarboxylase-like protein